MTEPTSDAGKRLVSFLNTPIELGVSYQGAQQLHRLGETAAERLAKDKAGEQSRAIRKIAEAWTTDELRAELDKEPLPEDLRALMIDTIAGRVWSHVYEEELRSAVDRLGDLAEGE